MTLVRWTDPYREFSHLQDRINRVFGDAYGRRDDEGMLSSGSLDAAGRHLSEWRP